ncbi:MAG: class I SAM-dependent methyltransferase [Erythrobacter sp.]|nr:class I SAM-dependent methyltransferase [Erythrobacter sp.]
MSGGCPLHRGQLYDAMHKLPDDYRSFVIDICRGSKRVLEMGVGTGRLMVPLIEAGHDVVGIDADSQMLECAREKLARAGGGADARLICADLTRLEEPIPADIAIFSSNTLSLIGSATGRSRIFGWLARSLQPDARIVVILNNTARLVRESPNRETVHTAMLDGMEVTVCEKRTLDPSRMMWVGTNRFVIDDLDGSKTEYCENVAHAAILPVELELIGSLHGLTIDEVFGDYDGGPFTRESRKLIAVLSRKEENAR